MTQREFDQGLWDQIDRYWIKSKQRTSKTLREVLEHLTAWRGDHKLCSFYHKAIEDASKNSLNQLQDDWDIAFSLALYEMNTQLIRIQLIAHRVSAVHAVFTPTHTAMETIAAELGLLPVNSPVGGGTLSQRYLLGMLHQAKG